MDPFPAKGFKFRFFGGPLRYLLFPLPTSVPSSDNSLFLAVKIHPLVRVRGGVMLLGSASMPRRSSLRPPTVWTTCEEDLGVSFLLRKPFKAQRKLATPFAHDPGDFRHCLFTHIVSCFPGESFDPFTFYLGKPDQTQSLPAVINASPLNQFAF